MGRSSGWQHWTASYFCHKLFWIQNKKQIPNRPRDIVLTFS